MLHTRRRKRIQDPLASRASVRAVLRGVAARIGEWAPGDEREITSLLRAAERMERAPTRSEGVGRPARWEPARLRVALKALRRELASRGLARTGARSFVEHYAGILSFPEDVAEALEGGLVNLFEAEQLARLSAKRLGVRAAAARRRRAQVLEAHLAASESGERLRRRVAALLASDAEREPESQEEMTIAEAAARLEVELEEIRRRQRHRPTDVEIGPAPEIPHAAPDHLFYEHLRGIAFALESIKPNDLAPEDLARVLDRADALILALQQVQRRGGRRVKLLPT